MAIKIKTKSIIGYIIIIVITLIVTIISYVKKITKCKHKHLKEDWIKTNTNYKVISRCKKCDKYMNTRIVSKKEYIKHFRKLKFRRILNEQDIEDAKIMK